MNKIVYRNLKPSHIFLTKSGNIKVGSFELCKVNIWDILEFKKLKVYKDYFWITASYVKSRNHC